MQTFGAEMTGYQRTLPRTKLLRQLRKHRARSAFRGEVERRDSLVAELRKARVTGIRVTLPVETLDAKLGSLPEGVSVSRDRYRGAVQRGEGGGGAALRAGLCARERLRAVRGARRWGSRRWGRGVRMSGGAGAGGRRDVGRDRQRRGGLRAAAGDRRRGGGMPSSGSWSSSRGGSRTSGRAPRTGGPWGSFSVGARREASASPPCRRFTSRPTSGRTRGRPRP